MGKTTLDSGILNLSRTNPIMYLENGNYYSSVKMNGSTMSINNTTGGIQLVAQGNGQVSLGASPNQSDSKTSLSVPTVGWCNTWLGKVKTVNGESPDSEGNVEIDVPTGTVESVDHIAPDQSGNV